MECSPREIGESSESTDERVIVRMIGGMGSSGTKLQHETLRAVE
jgi:hypothetical protein